MKNHPILVLFGVAMVHDVDGSHSVPLDADADLLAGLADDSADYVLAGIEFAAGEVEGAVGVAGTAPLGEQDLAVTFEDEHDVEDDGVRHGRGPFSGKNAAGAGSFSPGSAPDS